MDRQQWLAEQFEQHRPQLRAVAYRMLGSLSETDDALQNASLRASRVDASEVANLRAWLTTIVARVALNMLRARSTQREQPLETRVPDPIIDAAQDHRDRLPRRPRTNRPAQPDVGPDRNR